jgi:hypothetical protein
VSEQLLNRAYVVAVFEQVRGEAVAERVATAGLIDGRLPDGLFDCLLQCGLGEVVASHFAGAGVCRASGSGEKILPAELPRRVSVFSGERVREVGSGEALPQVGLVDGTDSFQLALKRGRDLTTACSGLAAQRRLH